ncbi:putative membrane protein YczE [Breznakia sp. PF5-3]|uniref:YczE/YyaS/YitT family protein n=1 Tax=unclassified Breznakia TaxID=2623764 RepID=UPI0024063674|nr:MULTISPECIES: hypothetical protein [unclassified Breznakia]MDF9824288.1 putative membrane protein YczE [Breznakia sp. PM6-1]MDF9835512.1 putative membrane protein YczE [Breznakia sp. PF5-3]MDF9838014.1 putative membrane protein YczE [Breznakia sp. PFB2-8]MDF9859392.1 putative membrane protein YczE [Breznakia sp. PH5-24]
MSKTIKTILGLFVAINLTGLGVALFVGVNLGSDTITVLVDGIHQTFDMSYGAASRVYNIIMLMIALAVARKSIGWTTVVYALSVGFSMDFFNEVLSIFAMNDFSLIAKVLCIILGQLCFGMAYALLIIFRKGMNQADAISYYIADKIHTKYVYVRTTMDIMMIVVGYLLGGIVGIGSIIAMCTTGIFVNMFLKIMHYEQ